MYSDILSKNGHSDVNFLSAEWKRKIEKTGSILPSGIYMVNYYLYKTVENCNWNGAIIVNQLFMFEIKYENFLCLIYPPDKDTLFNIYPNFKWLPLNTSSIDNIYEYRINIVEVLKEQVPEYAILYNLLYFYEKTTQTDLTYPLYAKKLESDKTYAWQVNVYKDNRFLLSSEVWTFTISNQQENNENLNENMFYLTLYDEPNQNKWTEVEDNYLYFVLDAEKNIDKNLEYYLYDGNHNRRLIISGKKTPLSYSHGKNFYALSISKFSAKNKYILEVKDNNSTMYLNFIKK